MEPDRQARVDFWKAVFTGLKTGRSVEAAIEAARLELTGSGLAPAAAKLLDDVRAGDRLSEAMTPIG